MNDTMYYRYSRDCVANLTFDTISLDTCHELGSKVSGKQDSIDR